MAETSSNIHAGEHVRDDTLVIGKTRCELLTRLAFTVNFEKSQLSPSKVISFLGFLIDSESMTISLPQVKVDTIVNSCQGLQENPSPSIGEVACGCRDC